MDGVIVGEYWTPKKKEKVKHFFLMMAVLPWFTGLIDGITKGAFRSFPEFVLRFLMSMLFAAICGYLYYLSKRSTRLVVSDTRIELFKGNKAPVCSYLIQDIVRIGGEPWGNETNRVVYFKNLDTFVYPGDMTNLDSIDQRLMALTGLVIKMNTTGEPLHEML